MGESCGYGVAFVGVEVVYGLLSNSMALVADAGHNLGDVLGLIMAWVAAVLARPEPSETHTYGLRRGTISAALANAMLLLLTVGAIVVETVRRLLHPEDVAGFTVMAVAAIGIVINGVTAWLFASGRKGDINLRGAFLHSTRADRWHRRARPAWHSFFDFRCSRIYCLVGRCRVERSRNDCIYPQLVCAGRSAR